MHDMAGHKHVIPHHHNTGNSDKTSSHSDCTGCFHCAWNCMHGCHGQLPVNAISVIIPDADGNISVITVNLVIYGFFFPLLRPPSLLNFNVVG